jgi:hypothetical protein
MTAKRFFLSSDNDGHWYLVPVEILPEWDRWCNLDADDEASWTPPEGAQRIGGSPSRVSFENPIEDL